MSEHIPQLPPEVIIQIGEVDLAIEEVLRSLDEHLDEMDIDLTDRSIILHHVRMAYIQGYQDRRDEGRLLPPRY